MRFAYSYTRLSTKEQLKGDGARRQIEDRDRWLAAHPDAVLDTEFALVDVKSAFRGDHARTGKLSLFLRAIEDGRIPRGSVLLLESYDRLSREQLMDSVYLLLGILRAGIDVVTFGSAGHEFRHDATGADQLMALMYSMMVLARANEESEIKSHRGAAVWDSRRKKARGSLTAFRAGNKPPWLEFDSKKCAWTVDKKRAKIVNRIIDDRIAGKSRRAIAKGLNAKGIKTWHPDRKGGAVAWSGTYVDKILRSRSLIGEYQPYLRPRGSKGRPIGDQITGFYPVVVSENRWLAAQAARNEGVNFRGRRGQFRNILRGLTQCACGSRTEFVDTGQSTYLRCTAAWHSGCENKRMHGYQHLEMLTLAALGKRAGSIVSGDPESVRNLQNELAGARALLADLKSRSENLIELAEAGAGASVAGRLTEIEAHISASQADVDAFQKSIAAIGEVSAVDTATLTEAWKRLSEISSPDEREALNGRLRRLLNVIVLSPDKIFFRWKDGTQATAFLKEQKRGRRRDNPARAEVA
jgi:DNA invertase Pin-like site-specific DNA recombinase